MKAIQFDRYGGPEVLRLAEIIKPTEGPSEVLVKIHAAATNPADWRVMRGKPYIVRLLLGGIFGPRDKGLGADFSGVVESVGTAVTDFQVGDCVFGQVNGETTGRPIPDFSAFAEYVCVSHDSIALKPDCLSHAQASAIAMAGITALQGVRVAGVGGNSRVLVNGASGGVGTFAVQIAKALGAHVTGVCSADNADLVRSLGVDEVIDYVATDFCASGKQFDLVFDTVNNQTLGRIRKVLKTDGVYVSTIGKKGNWLSPVWWMLGSKFASVVYSQRFVALLVKHNQADLQAMASLATSGSLVPVIDRTYPLDKTADALRYLEQGHAKGKVVIAI